MKNTLTAILLATSALGFSQEKLEVNYHFQYAFDLTKETKPSSIDFFKASNENTADYKLVTSKTEATFMPIEKLNNQQDNLKGKVYILPPKDVYYINYTHHELVEQKNMGFKNFIVTDSLPNYNWVMQKDKSKMLGYNVKFATTKQGNTTIEAWFAPSLNFKSGPFKFNGLPGLILQLTEIDAQGHKKITTATEVKINDNAKIVKPTKGEMISKEGFNNFMEDMMKKQQERLNNRVNRKID